MLNVVNKSYKIKNTFYYQMFRKLPIFFLYLLLFTIFLGCSPRMNQYENLLDQVIAQPQYLMLHRDSIRVRIAGSIPMQYLNSESKVYFYPEYQYGTGVLRLGSFVYFDDQASKNLTRLPIDQSIIFPYLDGMEVGTLVIHAIVEKNGVSYPVPEKIIAFGLNNAPMLARMGQIIPNEPISPIGLYMTSASTGINALDTREFMVSFKLGMNQMEVKNLPLGLMNLLQKGERGKSLKKVKVIGLVSPENQELADPNLAAKRVLHLKGILTDQHLLRSEQIEVAIRRKDWFDFRLLLGEYKGLSVSEREEYYDILQENTDYESQLRKMRLLSTYPKVAREVFPKLRGAKVELENTRLSDPKLASNIYSLLNEGRPLEGFSVEHLIYIAQSSNQLHEKEAIYSKLLEISPSESSYNNLGVVYLNQAQRELDSSLRMELVAKSEQMFRQSLEINASSIALHNLGRALILKGEYFKAYVAISEASGMERDENSEFLRINEGLRGAIDILNGDYKLATIRLLKANKNEVNLFNIGLAYFLANDFQNALFSFEESVQANRDYGYGFYGLAMIAALARDKEALFENLGKAIETSHFLKERAMVDPIFAPFRYEKSFIDLYK